jgi:hypothetical protein
MSRRNQAPAVCAVLALFAIGGFLLRHFSDGPIVNNLAFVDALYGPLLRSSRKDGLSLTTSVRAVGVTWLHADTAQLLVLADQTGPTTAGQYRSGAAQLSITTALVDGRWLVTDFTLL